MHMIKAEPTYSLTALNVKCKCTIMYDVAAGTMRCISSCQLSSLFIHHATNKTSANSTDEHKEQITKNKRLVKTKFKIQPCVCSGQKSWTEPSTVNQYWQH